MKRSWYDLGPELRAALADGKRRKRGLPSQRDLDRQAAQEQADAFNARAGVGTPVRYWTWTREGEGRIGRTRSPAQVLGGYSAVVWVTGCAGCIHLSHVEVVDA